MKIFEEVASWLQTKAAYHEIPLVQSLPSPHFRMNDREFVSFSTNNYLGMANHPQVIAAAQRGLQEFGVGNCESRLLGGDLQVYRDLEDRLAKMKKNAGALLFATGYLTNLGVLSTMTHSGQMLRAYGFQSQRRFKCVFFSDKFNHISIQEGIRMSGEECQTYPHLDMNQLESQLKQTNADVKIIVTDGVFSQDGDIATLPEMLSLADRYDAIIYIDDAHASGILGRKGHGTSEHYECYSPRIIQMGTLSKAFGAIGGFIAAEPDVVETLRLTCSGYGFTSTIPPDQAFALLEALRIADEEPIYRERLWKNQAYFVEKMKSQGMSLVSTQTPIVPLLIGDELICNQVSLKLRDAGIHVDSVKFPGVSKGKARLRFMLNAGHTTKEIDSVADALASMKPLIASGTKTSLT